MQTFIEATGTIELFTAQGGPDQSRWHNIRVHTVGTGVAGSAYVTRLRGESIVNLFHALVSNSQENYNSQHVLLKTGDVVKLDLGEATANVSVSMNVDTEEL